MALSYQRDVERPQAHAHAPHAVQPDLELFPFLTDTFIDSLTAAQAQQWAALVMPDTVASTIRKKLQRERGKIDLEVSA